MQLKLDDYVAQVSQLTQQRDHWQGQAKCRRRTSFSTYANCWLNKRP